MLAYIPAPWILSEKEGHSVKTQNAKKKAIDFEYFCFFLMTLVNEEIEFLLLVSALILARRKREMQESVGPGQTNPAFSMSNF